MTTVKTKVVLKETFGLRHRVSETLSYLSFKVSKDIIYHRSELLKLTSRALAQVRQS